MTNTRHTLIWWTLKSACRSSIVFAGYPGGFSSVLYMIACPVFLVLLYCLSVVNLRLMITSGFFNWLSFSIMCSVLLHPFSSGYCVVYPSTTHGFLLSLWCVQTFLIVLKLWWFSNNRLVVCPLFLCCLCCIC
jgi:hypothetical protein